MKLYYLLILLIISILGCGKPSPQPHDNYLGKTRLEVLQKCIHYAKYPFPGETIPQIMIGTGVGYRYFDTIAEAEKDNWLMAQPQWTVNFRKGQKGFRNGIYFYKLFFDDQGIVIDQSESFMSDF